MSESIVMELQKEAMDSSSKVSDLLRKSLVVAKKLNINEFEKWVNLELNGYFNSDEEPPEYREVVGTVEWADNYRGGWQRLMFEEEETERQMSRYKTSQSISEIESLIEHPKDYLKVSFTQKEQYLLVKATGRNTHFRVSLPKIRVKNILDIVRNSILNWTLELESKGILGEGYSFSTKEKEEAQKQGWVMNFHGDATGIQVQQYSNNSTQTMEIGMDLKKVEEYISNLKSHLSEVGLTEESEQLVQSEIDTITSQLESPKPEQPVIKESLLTIRNVLEGVTGSVIASGLLHMVQPLLGG